MTVKELIAQLSELDPNAVVFTRDSEYGEEEVTTLEKGKVYVSEYLDRFGNRHRTLNLFLKRPVPWADYDSLTDSFILR